MTPFRFEEVALRLQQVAQLEHHRACLVEDRQVEHTGFRTPLAGGVEPPQLALDRVRNGLEKTVAHREHQVDVAEVVGREHGVDAAVDRLHFVAHADQGRSSVHGSALRGCCRYGRMRGARCG